MKPEEQRIAIARAVGLDDIKEAHGYAFDGPHYRVAASSMGDVRAALPEYTKDLNAMNEAERVLNDGQYEQFKDALISAQAYISSPDRFDWRAVISSPASQRAEAFLRTVKLWVPSQQ
jgi:hypothetical protein